MKYRSMKYSLMSIFLIIVLLLSCKEFTFNFDNDTEGWIGGFSDYPVGEDDFFELLYEHSVLPPNLDQNSYSLKISGHNHSDDLFMFIKKKITGLKSNTNYTVIFKLEIASKYPEGSIGIGGSPGASVFLKVGATQIEPKAIEENGNYRMNIDKGNQGIGGENMYVIGNIGIPGEDFVYTLIQRNNLDKPFNVRSNSNSDIWLIIGTDSGFEGVTTLYYNSITVNLIES